MGHQPTIFYVLENETLGTWWVGKMTSTLDGCGMPPYRSITQDELNEKLSEKYHYPNAYHHIHQDSTCISFLLILQVSLFKYT